MEPVITGAIENDVIDLEAARAEGRDPTLPVETINSVPVVTQKRKSPGFESAASQYLSYFEIKDGLGAKGIDKIAKDILSNV
jgi:hypothetical protein